MPQRPHAGTPRPWTHVARSLALAAPLFALLTLLPRCGGGGGSPTAPVATPTPPLAERAVLALTVNPSPIQSQPGTGGAAHSATFTLNIRETEGLGGNVNAIYSRLYDAATGEAVGDLVLDPSDIISRAGTNHLGPRGQMSIQIVGAYSLPSGGSAAVIALVVDFSDDHGNNQLPGTTVNVL